MIYTAEKILKQCTFTSQLGPIIAIADENALYFLAFADHKDIQQKINRFGKKTACSIVPGSTPIIHSIQSELKQYFDGSLTEFKTPICLIGSSFQKLVWKELQKIPQGETRSYASIAEIIGRPKAYRAVAQANRTNPISILIPCHRVINSNGNLGGYAGGVARKKWLINHEKNGNQ